MSFFDSYPNNVRAIAVDRLVNNSAMVYVGISRMGIMSSGGDDEHPLLDFGDAREGSFFPSLKAASVQSAVPFGPRAAPAVRVEFQLRCPPR